MTDIYSDLYYSSYGTAFTPKQKVKSVFALSFNGVNFATDVISFSLKSKPLDSDRVTFGKYTSGRAVEWTLSINAVFDGGSQGSLHDWLWTYASITSPFIIRPFQDFDPNNKRFFQGQIRIPYKPDIKLEAGKTSVFDYEFKLVGHPSRSDKPNDIMTDKIYDEI